jgi:hypothetical protein
MNEITLISDKRWRHRVERWRRPEDGVFKPELYSVDVFTTDKHPRAFIQSQHYSGSYPAARFRVGLFGPLGELVGMAVFSEPTHRQFIPKWTGMHPSRGVELGRFVLVDSVAYNGETWFLARALKLLRKEKAIEVVVSCADPLERTNEEGLLTKSAHFGTIYQASNALHVGRTTPRHLYLAPDGTVLNERMLSKVRAEDQGWEYGYRRLMQQGAAPRLGGESLADWLARVLPQFRRLRHPGNLVYTFGLTKIAGTMLQMKYGKGLPYLKETYE